MTEAMHASAPPGFRCTDCAIDGEACPVCYAAWWRMRHPNVDQGARAAGSFAERCGAAIYHQGVRLRCVQARGHWRRP